MIGSFYESFKKSDNTRKLPKSVAKVLNSGLPKGFQYVYDDQLKHFVAEPIDKSAAQTFQIELDPSVLEPYPEWARQDMNSLMDYLYRTQQPIEITNAKITTETGESRNLSELAKDPFDGSCKDVRKQYLFPKPFPEPISVPFELSNGEIIQMKIGRMPCEERDVLKFQNKNISSIQIEWTVKEGKPNKNTLNTFRVSVSPGKAESANDVLVAYEILRDFKQGDLKIGGEIVGKSIAENPQIDIEEINTDIEYWYNLVKLEHLLNVHFDPKAELPVEDAKLYDELVSVFVENKDLIYTESIEYLTVNEEALQDENFLKAVEEKKAISLSYVQTAAATLLGAKFDLWIVTVIVGIIIDRVEKDGKDAKLFLARSGEKAWRMIKSFGLSESETEKIQKRLYEKYNN